MDLTASLSGIIVAALTQLAKKVSFIPINSGDTKKLRVLAGVLSIIAVLVTDFANGTLANSSALALVGNSIAAFVVSQLSYKGVKFGAAKLS